MRKSKIWALVVTVLTLLLCALLCTAVISLYCEGTARRAAAGSDREPIFSPEAVGRWLPWVLSLLGVWLAAGIGAALTGNLAPARTFASRVTNRAGNMGRDEGKRKTWVRALLAAAALALIVLGVCNGGLRDVLGKAVKICSECIGLG